MKKTIFVVLAFSVHLSFAEIIPLRRFPSGVPALWVDVQDAQNNPQRVLIDTGSDHSYLLKHSLIRDLPRARELPGNRIRGFRVSQIPQDQMSVAEVTHVNYDGGSGVRMERWTRKRFTSGTHSWIQKFAVAVLYDSQLATWNPHRSGLIGAGPSSKFAEAHHHFGLIPRRNGEGLDLFVNEPINPEWCRDGRIVHAPIIDEEYWHFESPRISIDGFAITVERFKVLADTGYGTIRFPQAVFDRFWQQLQTVNITSLRGPNGNGQYGFDGEHLSLIPDLTVELISGATITISKQRFCKCTSILFISHCLLDIMPYEYPEPIILGIQLFDSLVVEFDSSNAEQKQIGFCEPIDGFDASSPPRIIVPEAPPPGALPLRRPDTLVPAIVPPGAPPLRRPGITVPESPSPDAPPLRRPDTLVPGNLPPGALPLRRPGALLDDIPLRIPNDVVEDNDEADTNAEKPTGSDQKATRELQTYAIPIAMLVIASTLIA